jgi:hypothetical protein
MQKIATAIRSTMHALLFMGCIPVTGCSQPQAILAIDTGERHQIMAGWEVTARAWEFDKDNDRFDGSWIAQRDALAAMLVDEGGIDRLRLEIKSGIENPVDYWSLFAAGRLSYTAYKEHFYEKINDNDDPAVLDPAGVQFSDLDWRVENIVLPVRKRLEARGRHLRLNLAYVDFRWTASKGSLSHARNPAEYAELIAATFSHLKAKYDLVPDSLEVIIEPDNSDDWSGIAIGRAIVAASQRLEAVGFPKVEIIAPSTAKAQRATDYFRDIRRVPGAAARMNVLAYHRYDGAPDASDLNEIRDAAHGARMQTAMLEYVDGGIMDLLADLAGGDANAWQKYGIATRSGADGEARPGWLIAGDSVEGAPPKLRLTPTARALALAFNAIDQGSVRVGARSSSNDLAAVSFITPGGKLVIVAHALADMPLTIAGLPKGRYRLSSTTSDDIEVKPPREIEIGGNLKIPVVRNTTYALIAL